MKVVNPELIITGHTYQARDFMPRLSAKLDIPFIPDLVGIENSSYVKQIMNSKLNASISLSTDAALVSFQSATFNEEDIIKGSSSSEKFEIELSLIHISEPTRPY